MNGFGLELLNLSLLRAIIILLVAVVKYTGLAILDLNEAIATSTPVFFLFLPILRHNCILRVDVVNLRQLR